MIKNITTYLHLAVMAAKMRLNYTAWFWSDMVVQALSLLIMYYFWHALYENQTYISGQSLQQTLNYILLAQLLLGLTESNLIMYFAYLMYRGELAIELLRPIDFQWNQVWQTLSIWSIEMLTRLPMLVLALYLGLQLPSHVTAYFLFLLSLFLGMLTIIFFDWILASCAMLTQQAWGIRTFKVGIAAFLGGALLPLNMMPPVLKTFAENSPFSQVIHVPVTLLTGNITLNQSFQMLAGQMLWVVGLYGLSRWVFKVMVKKAVIQGG